MLYVHEHAGSTAVALVLASAAMACCAVWVLRKPLSSADAEFGRWWRRIDTPGLRMLVCSVLSPFVFLVPVIVTIDASYVPGGPESDRDVFRLALVSEVFLMGSVPAGLGLVSFILAVREQTWCVAAGAVPIVLIGTACEAKWWILVHGA